MKKILVTGAHGFTGGHFLRIAENAGYEPVALEADLLDKEALATEVAAAKPDYVVHLAAISAVTHADEEAFYKVNVFGTQNLLAALLTADVQPMRVLLASSANVYGNVDARNITEAVCPKPINHYAISKLAMEQMAMRFDAQLPVIVARPFNYTGVGHDERFVIPKIVAHFKEKKPVIELGNLNVYREYNDVRMVCDAYLKLLCAGQPGEIYNICTGNAHALQDVLTAAQTLTDHKLEVKVNPDFVRANEVHYLAGDATKLAAAIGESPSCALHETLSWMLGI